ncbi:MAG: UvrD-helicase domain-containing protein [Alphaproteobacteria bacterium]
MSVRLPTPEQLAAARPFASTWVSANAGSGKTRVLTDRVARLLLAGADPSRILCLTYTKAAAAEMERRLFETLGVWSMQEDADLAASLAAIEDEPVAHARLPEARRLFARALETPGGLKIETIHAFCQRVIQRFPVEAGVAPDFTVLDENEAGALVEAAKRALLRRVRAGASLALKDAFERLYEARGEAVLNAIIDDGLKRRGDIEALLADRAGEAAAAVRGVFGLAAEEGYDAVRASGHADPARDEAALRRAATALEGGSAKDVERARAIRLYLSAADRERDGCIPRCIPHGER